jgi:hypothetical protein
VRTKQGKPEKFEDRYEEALKDLLRRKAEGKPIERVKEERTEQRRRSHGCFEAQRRGRNGSPQAGGRTSSGRKEVWPIHGAPPQGRLIEIRTSEVKVRVTARIVDALHHAGPGGSPKRTIRLLSGTY